MVPYVRKSFYKHYRDGMKYLCNCNWNLDNYLEDSDIYKKIIDINSSVSLEEISREYNIEELLRYDVEADKERLAELVRSHESSSNEESSGENYVWQDASFL